jgi:hypothetical protein
MMKIKQIASRYDGALVILTEAGELYLQERDQQHSGPGEPGYIWRKIEGPPR